MIAFPDIRGQGIEGLIGLTASGDSTSRAPFTNSWTPGRAWMKMATGGSLKRNPWHRNTSHPGRGGHGVRVTRADELDDAVATALAHEGPALVEVISDAELI